MTVFDCLVLVPLSFAAWEDYRRRIIPNWTVNLILFCSVCKLVNYPSLLPNALLGFLAIGGLLLTAAVAMEGIGGGDVKLCTALGLLSGFDLGWVILLLSLSMLLVFGLLRDAKALPFAPFVWLAYLLVLPIFLNQGVVIDVSV